MIYLGIDPGVSGGIAALDEFGHCAGACAMPDTERDLWDSLRDIADGRQARAIIEQLGGMPRDKDGKAKQSPTTMMTMGRNYGSLRMALVAAGIPFDEVLPRKWQAEFGLLSRPGESKTAKKNRHKGKAQQIWPAVKVIHATADALLLAEYCRRTTVRVEEGRKGDNSVLVERR